MTGPTWLPTARALAAVWDGPELAQFVVSVAEYQRQCWKCREPWDGPRAYCSKCGQRPPSTIRTKDADTVPDLSSNAVGGEVLGALWKLAPDARPEYYQDPEWVLICWDYGSDDLKAEGAATLAEAAALAYVAVR